jgi:hypothetical protein
VNDTPLPAPLGNKAFYQWSTFCAAFGQMMANKPGAYVLDDSSESALAAVLANILTESDTEPNIISVTYSPTPVFNAANSNGFQMTLSGNIASSTISGVTAGQLIAFYFAQDSVGGRTVSWPYSFVGALQPDPTPFAVSVMLFRADLTGNPRAVSPMISNNFTSLNALTVAAGAPVGAVLIGNGTIYAPVANGGFTFGNNGNGYWVIDPAGHIHQWGSVSGIISTGSIIPFAIPFTNAASVVPVASAIITHGSGIGYPSITNGSVTTTQFGVEMGSNPSQGIYWSADGY